jgi:tetratricopeptide (TPR) repeat protein
MVEAVLEGSIRQSGERIRILMQLVDAREGAMLWAEQFDEPFTDIFTVEDRVSDQVTRALLARINGDERQKLNRRSTQNAEAYRLYLKGRYFWSKRTESDLKKGIEFFERAIEFDSQFALSWAGLADSYLLGASSLPPLNAMPKAKAAALKALSLDDALCEAHTSLARVLMCFDWDWLGAEREFKRALELNPHYTTARQWYANYLLATGRIRAAIAEITLACEMEPCSLMLNCALGWVYNMSRRHDQALDQYLHTLEMDPRFVLARREVAFVYEQQRKYEEALAAIDLAIQDGGENPIVLAIRGRILASAGQREAALAAIAQLVEWQRRAYVAPQLIAVIYAALGDRDQAFAWLNRAYGEHASPLVWLKVDPWVDQLRSDPRFDELLRQVGLDR